MAEAAKLSILKSPSGKQKSAQLDRNSSELKWATVEDLYLYM